MKSKKFLTVLFAVACLASCSGPNTSSSGSSSSISSSEQPVTSTSTVSSSTSATSTLTSSSTTSSSTTSTTASSSTSSSSSSSSSTSSGGTKLAAQMSHFQKIKSKINQTSMLPSLGSPNILVVPIEFSDYTFEKAGAINNEDVRNRLEDAFFGERSEIELHESLASYYEKSSYGKLTIKGEVSPVIRAPRTYSSLKNITSEDSQLLAVDTMIKTALTTLNTTTDLTKFDADGDGYFDAIWLVYSAPIDNTGDSMFWAFTYWSDLDTSYQGITPSAFSFASYEFLDEGGYTDHPDAHTLIHETGHLFGLDDFYDYTGITTPVGGLDMMDNNIGDHMAFSKYNLDWITPEVISESGTYTLSPLVNSPQAYIIAPESYNYTEFWEYYIVEYYRPEGLNKLDAVDAYSNGVKMFTTSGLRVYRVNQKLGYITYNSRKGYVWDKKYIYDVDNADYDSDSKYPYIINSNTSTYSYNTNTSTTLVSLVSASGRRNSDYAKNSDIFTEGSTYDTKSLTWEDGEKMNFSFTIDSVTTSSLTFTFTKN